MVVRKETDKVPEDPSKEVSALLAARIDMCADEVRDGLGNDPAAYSSLDTLVEYARSLAAAMSDEQLWDIFKAELAGEPVEETELDA